MKIAVLWHNFLVSCDILGVVYVVGQFLLPILDTFDYGHMRDAHLTFQQFLLLFFAIFLTLFGKTILTIFKCLVLEVMYSIFKINFQILHNLYYKTKFMIKINIFKLF